MSLKRPKLGMLLDVFGCPLEIVRGPTAEVLELRSGQRPTKLSREGFLSGDPAASRLSGFHATTDAGRKLSRAKRLLLRVSASCSPERAPNLLAWRQPLGRGRDRAKLAAGLARHVPVQRLLKLLV